MYMVTQQFTVQKYLTFVQIFLYTCVKTLEFLFGYHKIVLKHAIEPCGVVNVVSYFS